MSATRNPLIERYLSDLRSALRDLPRRQRDDLTGEIEAHIAEALAPGASDADVLTLLDRLGDPEQIAAAERERLGIEEPTSGWLEWLAIPLLLIGGVVIPVVGWMVGVVFLWLSRCWSVRDKLLATLLVPGGLFGALLLPLYGTSVEVCSGGGTGTPARCTGGTSTGAQVAWIAFEIFLVVAPIYTAVRLTRRLPARSAPGRRLSLPRRQSVALLLLGAAIGGVAAWLVLSSRPPGNRARAEVLTGVATHVSPDGTLFAFRGSAGSDALGLLDRGGAVFRTGAPAWEDCRSSCGQAVLDRPCLRPGSHNQPLEIGVVQVEAPGVVRYDPVVWIRCLPG